MLLGGFDAITGMPFVYGRVMLPDIAPSTEIQFLVDTGSTSTMLLPRDSMRMGIDFDALPGRIRGSVGIGGNAELKRMPALMLFREPERGVYVYEIELAVARPHPSIGDLPSLLGRDILNRWDMHYSAPTDSLTFEVLDADHTVLL